MGAWIFGLALAGVGLVFAIVATVAASRGVNRLTPSAAAAGTHDIDHNLRPARAGWVDFLAVSTMVCAAISVLVSIFPERDWALLTTWLAILFPLAAAIGALLLAMSFSPEMAPDVRGPGRARLLALVTSALFFAVFLLALIPTMAPR